MQVGAALVNLGVLKCSLNPSNYVPADFIDDVHLERAVTKV